MAEEQNIKRVSRRISAWFYGVWIGSGLLVALFESGCLPVGSLAGEDMWVYCLQTLGVLLALALIPASLKFFHVRLRRLRGLHEPERALQAYARLSALRIGGLALPIFYNLVLYYLSLNKAPGFLVLITLLATIFCIPGEARLKYELWPDENDVQKKKKTEEK